tara:strand:- start:98 stop:424 length:327 start_codon:yes stop_codon:yes gene_type:complete
MEPPVTDNNDVDAYSLIGEKRLAERDLKEELDGLNDQWKGGSTSIRPKYYAKYKIDPWTFIIENQLGMDVGSVVKYVVRHKDKNGVEDLNKAIKCIEMMKEYYYNEKS